jgi:hypothetical protein
MAELWAWVVEQNVWRAGGFEGSAALGVWCARRAGRSVAGSEFLARLLLGGLPVASVARGALSGSC